MLYIVFIQNGQYAVNNTTELSGFSIKNEIRVFTQTYATYICLSSFL